MKKGVEQAAIEALLSTAAAQHQVVSVAQASRLGVSPRALSYAVRRGWLRPVRRGVVAVAGGQPSVWEPLVAAALAAGPDAVISHLAAANVHHFHGIAPSRPELTLPRSSGIRLSGVRAHRSVRLDPVDVEVRSGVRLTTAVRTVIDIAPSTGDYLLGRIIDQGSTRRLWTPELIVSRLDALGGRGRPGTARLRRLLDVRRDEAHQDGELEQRVLRVLRGLQPMVPEPVVHYQLVLGDSVIDMDLAWPRLRIDGEIDGLHAHVQRSDFDRDRRRANLLGADGWRIIHWTSTMDDDAIAAATLPYFSEARGGALRAPLF